MTRKGITRRQAPQGPYSVGKWSTWQQGLPNGRPDVEPPPPGEGACAPDTRMGDERLREEQSS